jgi:hypothetical protein
MAQTEIQTQALVVVVLEMVLLELAVQVVLA